MNELRWILLLAGLVLIAFIYWRGRRARSDRRGPGRRRLDDAFERSLSAWESSVGEVEGQQPQQSEAAHEMHIEPPLAESAEEGLAPPESGGPSWEEEDEFSAAPAPRHGAQRQLEDRIAVIYLVAPRGSPYQGETLRQAFEAEGLVYGDMRIYHRMVEGGQTLFSVANLVEPGNFDSDAMPTLRTPGVALFLRVPGPVAAGAAFDDLHATARALAGRLGGELRDEQRNPLTEQAARHLREELVEFETRILKL